MPVWLPDGSRVVFPAGGAFSGNLFWIPADGSGTPERLTTSEVAQFPSTISRNNVLAFVESGDIWTMELNGKSAAKAVLNSPAFEGFPDFSPDGRYLAYTSIETGRPEVWIQPFPGPGGKQPVSNGGGQAPVWRGDGRELFYHSPHFGPPAEGETVRMMAVSVAEKSSVLTIGSPTQLFEGAYFPSGPIRSYDVTRDGQRFLMVQMDERPLSAVREIVVVQNWRLELAARVPRRD
jgi:Tol biopolymer transport system component